MDLVRIPHGDACRPQVLLGGVETVREQRRRGGREVGRTGFRDVRPAAAASELERLLGQRQRFTRTLA